MEQLTVQGVTIPALGFGTWKMKGHECRQAVEHALDLGYRHIDTAQMYENEAAVGDAIDQANVDASDVFLVTKIQRKNLAYDDVLDSVAESLDRLGTGIDLLLIHAPSDTVPIEETIEAMNRLQDERPLEHIGVSNFSVAEMEAAIAASETPILTNQVKFHPYRRQPAVHEFCVEEGIMLTAHTPLGRGDVIEDSTLSEIGERYGKTAAQVSLRWLLEHELVAPIPKAASPQHRAENLDVFDFSLTAAEMQRIEELA